MDGWIRLFDNDIRGKQGVYFVQWSSSGCWGASGSGFVRRPAKRVSWWASPMNHQIERKSWMKQLEEKSSVNRFSFEVCLGLSRRMPEVTSNSLLQPPCEILLFHISLWLSGICCGLVDRRSVASPSSLSVTSEVPSVPSPAFIWLVYVLSLPSLCAFLCTHFPICLLVYSSDWIFPAMFSGKHSLWVLHINNYVWKPPKMHWKRILAWSNRGLWMYK